MSAEITHITSDLDSGPELAQLIDLIMEDQSKKQKSDLLKTSDNYSAEDFLSKVDNLQEYFYDTTVTLTKYALEDHHFLWLYSLEGLASQLLKFRSFFDKNFLSNSRSNIYESDKILGNIGAKLGKLFCDFGDISSYFLTSESLKLEKYISTSINVLHQLFNLIIQSLEVIIVDKVEEMQYIDNSEIFLKSISQFLLKYYDSFSILEEDFKDEIIDQSFPMLTQFIKVSYVAGESQFIIPFLKPSVSFQGSIINPKTPIRMVQTSSVHYIDLINYYKFTAFNLLTLSLSDKDKVITSYNQQADIYFKVLLKFPNLSLNVYFQFIMEKRTEELPPEIHGSLGADKQDKLLVSILEREEISLLFILNYLLKISDLNQLVNPEVYYRPELQFLSKSLSSSLSQGIESASGSVHSSTISFYQLAQSELNKRMQSKGANQINKIKLKSLSTMLLYGSYKEKLTVIVQFCESLSQNTLNISKISENYSLHENSATDFQHISSMIDPVNYPGKISLVQAIDKITKLLVLVGIKFLVVTSGMNDIYESYLNNMFTPSFSVLDVFKVRDLLQHNVKTNQNGERIIHFETSTKFYECEMYGYLINRQLELSNTTKDLEKIVNRLK